MPDWMERPIHQAIYSLERSLAQWTWGFDRSGLAVIDLLNRFRHGLVTEGFTTALDEVAVNIVGVSRPMFELALVLGALLIVASPLMRFQWINMRKAFVLALLVPILLPLIAAKFQDIDGARGDMADTFYNHIFDSTDFAMGGDGGGTGTGNDMGPLVPFSSPQDERNGLRGVDVAAAYLYATRDDVVENRDLPTGFAQRYFPHTMEGFGALEAHQRWAAIQEGGNGITRTVYGVIILMFAFFETLTNLGFTLALGFLLIALIISILFAFFTPFEGMFLGLLKKLAELFMQSWAISALQALLLAAVISVANGGSGTATLGMGIVGLFLQGMFTMIAYKSVIGSVTGLGTGGGLMPFEATRLLSGGRALAGAAVGAATAAPRMAMAASAARQAGASGAFQGAYALGATKPGAAIGALAAAMGMGGSEFVAGAAQAQSARRYDTGMASPVARQSIAGHVERDHEKQHRAAEQPQRDADRTYQRAERQRREQERTTTEQQVTAEAPIRALGVPQIAGALIGQVAQRSASGKPATGQDVARSLGLPPQAFGQRTAAVSTLADTLHKTPLPDSLAQQLLVERGLEGGFRHETWGRGMQALTDAGLSDAQATTRMQTLETQMGAIPTSITPADLAQPLVDGVRHASESSAGARSYQPLPSEQAAQRGRAGGNQAATPAAAPPAADPTAPPIPNQAVATPRRAVTPTTAQRPTQRDTAPVKQAGGHGPAQRMTPPATHAAPPAHPSGQRKQKRRKKKNKRP